MTRMRVGRKGIALTAGLLMACGGDDDPAGVTGSIQVGVQPATLSVQQGSTGSVTAVLTRGGGFTGPVTLVVSGLPTGITTELTPSQLQGTTATAMVAVAVPAAATPGTSTATITATAQGVIEATTTFQLTVVAAPNFALTLTPATLTAAAGSGGGATVNINRTNFTGGVAFTLVNPTAGITGVFTPATSTTNESALALSVAANVTPGTYPLTIQGTATGPGVRSAILTLTVTAPPAGGGNVVYQYCDVSAAPVFFAYQDGTGAWQPLTGTITGSSTTFSFTLTQGRGGVLAVHRFASSIVADVLTVGRSSRVPTRMSGLRHRLRARPGIAPRRAKTVHRSTFVDAYVTEILYASTTELADDATETCTQTQPTKTLTGTVAGVSNGQLGIVSLGNTTEVFLGGTSTNPVTFTGVPQGVFDVVGTRLVPGTPPDKVIVIRNLNVPDGGVLPSAIDFNGAAAVAPATAPVTITGAGAGDELEVFTELVTANSHALMYFEGAPGTATTRTWAGLPPSLMVSSDFHGLVVFAAPAGASGDFRVSLKFVGPVAGQTVAFGPTITAPTISQVAIGAYPRFRFQGAIPAVYNKGVSLDVASGLEDGNAFSILATNAYLTAAGNALGFDFTMPDVSTLAGFPAAARLTAGTNDVFTSTFSITGSGVFEVRPSLGSEFKGATVGTVVTVP